MADTDKNILITPSRGATDDPTIVFTGGGNNPITLSVLDSGTLSFTGSAGQLFSVSDNLSGTIFSVNDASGVPSIEVDDDGTVRVAEYGGSLLVGDSGPYASYHPLQVKGSIAVGGVSSPYIEFYEGTDDRMSISYSSLDFGQWQVFDNATPTNIGVLRLRSSGDLLTVSGDNGATEYKVWHAGNDGASSGLDADTLDGNHATAFATSAHNHTYDVNNPWLRDNGDNANVKLYGNSRQMAFRTDGTTEYATGVGPYPFAFMYGSDADTARLMLLSTGGDLWTKTSGWISTAFAAATHTHAYLPTAGGTVTGTLTVSGSSHTNSINLFTESGTAQIADTFADTTTHKSYITFGAVTGSNDPGFIMHETSETAGEANEGVIHLCPSDDNGYGDYVSIHGTNDADVLKLHTDGTVEGVTTLKISSWSIKQNGSGDLEFIY